MYRWERGIKCYKKQATLLTNFITEDCEVLDLSNISIKKLGEYIFSQSKFKEIILNEDLEIIDFYCFSNSALEHIEIPNNLKDISCAFCQTDSLQSFKGQYNSNMNIWSAFAHSDNLKECTFTISETLPDDAELLLNSYGRNFSRL